MAIRLSTPSWSRRSSLKVALLALVVTFGRSPLTLTCSAQATRFAIIGDFGVSEGVDGTNGVNTLAVANLVKSWNPEFIITTGDNSYPDSREELLDPNIGQYYHEYIGGYSGAYGPDPGVNRFYPSLGNHDYNGPPPAGSSDPIKPYLDFFPQIPDSSSGNHRYYDFVQGPVHFFVVNSNGQDPDGNSSNSAQAQWLHTQLTASTSTWNLVYFHHPPYSSGNQGNSLFMRWDFETWGADLVINGHDHTYERFDIDGFPYIVNGLGGKGGPPLSPPYEPGSQVAWKNGYGAQLVEATDEYMKLDFISTDNVVIDSFTLGTIPNPHPEVGLMVTEIMYDPAGSNEHEYVELYNGSSVDVDLSDYTLNGNKLADGSMIPARGTAVIVRTDSADRPLQNYIDAWGADINFVELDNGGSGYPPWQGLSNGGSIVEIIDDQSGLVASITYDNAAPWPRNNNSSSIYLTDTNAENITDGTAWALSVAGDRGAYQALAPRDGDVGSPGFVYLGNADADFDGDGLVTGADYLAWQRGFSAASPGHADGDANGDGMVDHIDLALWQQQFGTSMLCASDAVPEPSGYLLFAVAGLIYLKTRDCFIVSASR